MRNIFSFSLIFFTYLLLLSIGSISAKGQANPANSANTRSASSVTVTGRVVDEKDVPMIGVSIQVKNSGTGVTTDSEGRFTINVPDNKSTLVISYSGYVAQELSLTNVTDYTIRMAPGINSLNEVVVVGYSTQRRRDVSGSVVSVSADQLKNQSVTGFDQALKGQAAGVQVVQNTGAPGGGVTVRIRGNSSITAGNDPLYVIDGFPVTGGSRGTEFLPVSSNPLNAINPADIESIDI